MITTGMMSSAHGDWATPAALFADLSAKFGPFDLDVCATDDNAKCARFYTPAQDGLLQDWTGRCWMNPPYGRQIGRWVRKAYWAGKAGAIVVCLLPARTDTAWWHDYCMQGRIEFLRGRVHFERDGMKAPAPFPSAVVIFGW